MKKIYKVMFLLHDSVLNGGATRSMLDIIVKLKKDKLIEPIVIYPDNDETMLKYLDEFDIKYYHIKYCTWFYNKEMRLDKKIIFMIKSIIKHFISYFNSFKLGKLIKCQDIDLIYTNTKTVYMGCYLRKKYNIPHVWHIREFGKEDHNIDPIFGEKSFDKLLNNNSDKIIVISNSLKNKYISRIYNTDKVEVLYDDIGKNFINTKETFNEEETLNIAMIGTISEGKGQLEVIKAIEMLKNKNIKLYIAGEKNDYSKYLEEYIEINDLKSNVEFVGYINKINDFRKKMDVAIVASQKEAFGRTTIEGMLSQMLIIASNSGSNLELVKNGENGYIYTLHNEEELAQTILNIYDNRDKLREIALNGYYFAQKFTEGTSALKIYELIDELIKHWNMRKNDD